MQVGSRPSATLGHPKEVPAGPEAEQGGGGGL